MRRMPLLVCLLLAACGDLERPGAAPSPSLAPTITPTSLTRPATSALIPTLIEATPVPTDPPQATPDWPPGTTPTRPFMSPTPTGSELEIATQRAAEATYASNPIQINPETSSTPTPSPTPDQSPVSWAMPIIYQEQDSMDLYLIDATNGQRRLLVGQNNGLRMIAWSVAPNGRSVALLAYELKENLDPSFTSISLWIQPIHDGARRKLLTVKASDDQLSPELRGHILIIPSLDKEASQLQWTPDGRWIVFPSLHEGQPDIYAIEPDNGATRRLTHNRDSEGQLLLAADGQRLLFSSRRWDLDPPTITASLWQRALEGGEPELLVEETATQLTGGDKPRFRPLGWIADAPVGVLTNEGHMSVLVVEPQGPRTIYSSEQGHLVATINNDQLFFGISSAFHDPQIGMPGLASAGLYRWSTGQAMATREQQLTHEIVQLDWSPQAQSLFFCQRRIVETKENGVTDTKPLQEPGLIRDGQPMVAQGSACSQWVTPRWRGEQTVASGGEQWNSSGAIVDAGSGTPIGPLPLGAVPAGWNERTLYFFALASQRPEQGFSQSGWQLLRVALDQPESFMALGSPFIGAPWEPQLLP